MTVKTSDRSLKLILYGNPIAKMRPRFSSHGRFMRAYDPQSKEKEQCKKIVLATALNDFSSSDLEHVYRLPLSVDLSFHIQVPKSSTEAQKNAKLWSIPIEGQSAYPTKADIDNFIKFILDIGNGILWHDDAQIVRLFAKEIYSETPCTEIIITPIKISMDKDTEKLAKLFSPKQIQDLYRDLMLVANSISEMNAAFPEDQIHFMAEISRELSHFASHHHIKLKKMVAKDGT